MAGDNAAFETLHLKLDRLLAGQSDLEIRLGEHESALEAQTMALELLRQTLDTQTEMLGRLNEAVSQEQQSGASDIHELLSRIAASLKAIAADASETRVALGRLPSLLERAALDAAHMMRGDGVSVP